VSLAQARLKSAQDRAAAARASLLNLELKAPFAGTVSKVNFQSGEWVIPGQPVLTLADLDHLRVETTDLSELDVPRIELGQLVTLVIDALNQEITGRVSQIAPLADTLGGDVVYKTTIDLDSLPPGLRAGMSVEAQFNTGQ
jgi:HlyD family secretion protein